LRSRGSVAVATTLSCASAGRGRASHAVITAALRGFHGPRQTRACLLHESSIAIHLIHRVLAHCYNVTISSSSGSPIRYRGANRWGAADGQSTKRPLTIAGQPGAKRLWTPAPADHVAASVVGRDAEPIAIRPGQGFPVGIVRIAGGRDGVFDAPNPAAD